MSADIAKRVEISEEYAERLEELAKARGAAEKELVEEGLALLFQEQARNEALEKLLQEDREELRRLEAELGPLPSAPGQRFRIDRNEIVSIVGTPVDPSLIRRPEDHW